MVNINKVSKLPSPISTKCAVLSLLREQRDTFLSGGKIADTLQLSRVAVWKAIQALEDAGYGIETQKNGRAGGYSLIKDIPDALFEWEFAQNEKYIRYFDTIDSTMNEARRLAVTDASCDEAFFIVIANKQTAGRGTKHRDWYSAKHSLFFTLLIRKDIPTTQVDSITAAAQTALVKTLNRIIKKELLPPQLEEYKKQKPFQLRGSNDVWIQLEKDSERQTAGKVAGILTEYLSSGGLLEWCSLGIGVNINGEPKEIKKAKSINDVLCHFNIEKTISRKEILSSFLNDFRERFERIENKK